MSRDSMSGSHTTASIDVMAGSYIRHAEADCDPTDGRAGATTESAS